MAGTLKVGGKVLATHNSETDEISLASDTNIKSALNASGNPGIYACRAWVNFNGTGTVAIRGSGNVSSITDNDTGDYTVNFTTAMPDTNYCAVSNCEQVKDGFNPGNSYMDMSQCHNFQTGSVDVATNPEFNATSIGDCAVVQVTVTR